MSKKLILLITMSALIVILFFQVFNGALFASTPQEPSFNPIQPDSLYEKNQDSLSYSKHDAQNLNAQMLYEALHTQDINYEAFELALQGYLQIDKRKQILTLIDFSKPSTLERLYVIDLNQKKILFKSHVSHGKNSGSNMATQFSNRNGSNQSSLGFYRTAETYIGKNGYSLKLDGLEKGINDQARARAIVIHGAAYANPSSAASRGRLGRSLGCPALPPSLNRPIIETIKGGSILFIYAPDKVYSKQSVLLSTGNRKQHA